MTPLRLVVLIILFYIFYRLVFKKKKINNPSRNSNSTESKSSPLDVLVEDPICHTFVPKRFAVTYSDKDEVVYFCSDKCYQAYLLQKGGDS